MDDDTRSKDLTLPEDEPWMSHGFISKIAAQVSLPYRRPKDGVKEIERRNGSLVVRYVSGADYLPYGKYPRLFELWACTMIKTNDPCFDPETNTLHLGTTFREFDARERFRALEDFISWNITANGYACTYAIHTDKDGRNPHAHILVANRRIDPKTGRWAAKSRSEFALDANGRRIPVIDPDTGRQKIGARNRKVWKRVNVSNNPLDSKEFLERLRREWADSCNALLPGYAVIDHRSFKARGIERIPTIHEGYASREMEKRGGRGDLCEENRRIQALNRLLDALRAMIGRLSDQAQGILTAVKRRQRPSGAPQAPSSPEPAERPQERPQARETPPQAPQEPPKPIRTKKALTDRFKTRLDERLAENERKQAEKQAEPDMEETWDLSDPADPLNIGMGWGTGGHGLGL